MIVHLAQLLEAFLGSLNQTRCFTHILNLITKCIMKQFDAPKKMIRTLIEERIEESDSNNGNGDSDDGIKGEIGRLDDSEEDIEAGAFNGREAMACSEIKELEASVKPVRLVLVKVGLI